MIQNLSWDSNFFSLRIGKTTHKIDPYLVSKNFDLIYCFANSNDQKLNEHFKKIGAKLVDQKIIFYKTPDRLSKPLDNSISIIGVESYDNLKRLSYQSGEYSRFNIDKRLPAGSFEKLYSSWLRKSLTGEIANKVYVSKYSGIIKGFITLGMKGNKTDIGLLAVDYTSRGLGIGKNLINCSNQHAINRNSQEIQVYTQKQNKNACNFYSKNGFREGDITNIYHYWTSV